MATSVERVAGTHLLLVEDQPDLVANIFDFFERRGYRMDHAQDGVAGLKLATELRFDLVILDLGLPRMDGLELCRRLRAVNGGVPVLMLTARDTLDDKLRGFAEGADDYVVKPFALPELEARVRALLRRGKAAGAQLKVGDLELDVPNQLATRGGRRIPLSPTLSRLLEILMRRSPAVVDHADAAALLGNDGELSAAALQTQVYALRELVDRGFARPLIHTVRGRGYRMYDDGSR